MTIDSNGNVGIGTTAPSSKLEISDISGSYSLNTYPWPTATIALGGRWYSQSTDSIPSGGIRGWHTYYDGSWGGGVQLLYTPPGTKNLTPGFTMDHNGYVGIGTTLPTNMLTVSRQLGGSDPWNVIHSLQIQIKNGLGIYASRALGLGVLDNGWGMIQAAESGVGYPPLLLNPTSGNVGIATSTTAPSYTLHVNGSVGATSFVNTSDRRYKKDIQDLAGSLAKVLAIRGVSYKWIDEERYGPETHFGVIAQELEKVVPEVVHTGSDGVKRVRYNDLIPLIIEAMKAERAEKNAEIEALNAESAALKLALCSKFPDLALCQP
jgi:hypothetical protein